MGKDVKIEVSKAYTRVEVKQAKSDPVTMKDEKIEFEPVEIAGTPETVSVSMGLTMNLGNFESARIDVFRSMPIVPSNENANTAFEEIKKWVGEKLQAEIKSVRGESVLDVKSKFNNKNVENIF